LHCIQCGTVQYVDRTKTQNFLHDDQLRLNFTFVGERTFVSGQRTGFAFPEKEKNSMQCHQAAAGMHSMMHDAAAATGTSGYAATPRGLEERPLPRLAAAQLKKLQHGHN
jgi:hypothetical protein